MFKWFRDWLNQPEGIDNSGFLEDYRKEVKHQSYFPPDPEEAPLIYEPEPQASVRYFTLEGGEGNVFMNIIMEASEASISDMAKVVASVFSTRVQANTIKVVRDNLIKSERADLVELFDKELVAATIKMTKTGEEEPCVSPSDLMT